MARFFGKVGYGHTVELEGSVHKTVITEREYYGEVDQPARRFSAGDKVNGDVEARNTISVVADEYANENIFAIRFVEWGGTRWIVTYVTNARPRLILTLGGVYNGPTA